METPVVVLTVGDLVRGSLLLLAALAAVALLARRRGPPGALAPTTPAADPPPPAEVPRSVKASFARAIEELAGVEELRQSYMERYGTLSDEMEEVFTACRRAVKEQQLATLRQEVNDLLGVEVPDAR